MEELIGILSDEEAEKLKEAAKEVRSEMTKSFERSVEKKWSRFEK